MFDLVPFNKNNQVASRENFFNQMFDNFFKEDFFAPFTTLGNSGFHVDLKETGSDYQVEADLPGIKKEDISLQYANNYLTIAAKRDEVKEDRAEENYLRRERHYGQFQRSFYVSNVADDKISAEFKDGVLKIVLPKQDTTARTVNTIPIK
ncbi:MAG: heat shock protein Hsp18 [Veillonellales bacterium]